MGGAGRNLYGIMLPKETASFNRDLSFPSQGTAG